MSGDKLDNIIKHSIMLMIILFTSMCLGIGGAIFYQYKENKKRKAYAQTTFVEVKLICDDKILIEDICTLNKSNVFYAADREVVICGQSYTLPANKLCYMTKEVLN